MTRRKDGKVILDAIRNDTPDVVVMDAVLPGMDAIEILEKSQTFETAPAFIITSSYENAFIERQVMEKGAAYFMLKPFHISTLGSRITDLAAKGMPNPKNSANRNMEVVVTEMIHQLGVPAHIKGYHYLRAAILASIENQALLESVTKLLYPTVAMQFDTTSSRVERAIRHAIEIAWDRGDLDTINSFFGYTVNNCKGQAYQFRIHCPADRQAAAAIRQKHRPSRLRQYHTEPVRRLNTAGFCILFVCYRKKFNFFVHFPLQSAIYCGKIKRACICSGGGLSADSMLLSYAKGSDFMTDGKCFSRRWT